MDEPIMTTLDEKDQLEKQKEIAMLQKKIAELEKVKAEATIARMRAEAETELAIAEAEQKKAEAEKLKNAAKAQSDQLIAEAEQKRTEAEKLRKASEAQTEQLVAEAEQKKAEAVKAKASAEAELEQVLAEVEQKVAEAHKAKISAEAQTDQIVAEAKQKTAEAERATLLAKFPKGETKGLEGTITADDKFGYAAEIVSYEAISRVLNELSYKIKTEVPKTKDIRILIVNDQNFAVGDVVRLQLEKTINVMNGLLKKQKSTNDLLKEKSKELTYRGEGKTQFLETAVVAPIVIQSLISNSAEIASFFQSNFNITGQDFEISREAITLQMVDLIKELNPMIFNFYILENSKTLDAFSELLELKQQLIVSQSELKNEGIEPLMARIARDNIDLERYKEELKKNPDDTDLVKQIEKNKKELTEKNQKLEEANAANSKTVILADAFDKFIESITKPASQTDLPVLAQAALREFIIEKQISHLLWIMPISSGGEAITKRQLFRSGHVSYIGGCVISFIVATKDGKIVSSGTSKALSQMSHVLSTNRSYRLKNVAFITAEKNIWERFFDWLNI